MEKIKKIWLLIWIYGSMVFIIYGVFSIGYNVGYEGANEDQDACDISLAKCESDLRFYDILITECDSCVARLTNNSDTLIACQQIGDENV
jgi:hypothetical protein